MCYKAGLGMVTAKKVQKWVTELQIGKVYEVIRWYDHISELNFSARLVSIGRVEGTGAIYGLVFDTGIILQGNYKFYTFLEYE